MKIFRSPCCIQIPCRRYRRLIAVNSRKRNIDSCCDTCSLLCNWEERYCCITVIRCCRCTVHIRKRRPRWKQFIQKYNIGNSVPNIVIMRRIFLTIAVSVATCERSFSKLKLIKNYELRSSMTTLRLRNLATLSIKQQLTYEINFDIAVEEFDNKKARKVTV